MTKRKKGYESRTIYLPRELWAYIERRMAQTNFSRHQVVQHLVSDDRKRREDG